ncbi:hypothetical protein L198_05856 [Cryptococcus wingfieldii CBS 7118]|uniref:Uncharacterized protein n=1 Tax=Cryptococcus wingfieldii CBS 7118 TaxID=1295528 RepID=A0A1E3ISB2_9TREE|nr:hypothetical protein L198_05856 [Cryptococcus wingfieldii CBS 7118]ODN91345.1 hypothetical protein L198_05856 [Cryptococcus wingfieldii CBS 7118]
MINDFGAPAAENQKGRHLIEFSDPKIESHNILHIFLTAITPQKDLFKPMVPSDRRVVQEIRCYKGRNQNVITPIDIFVAAAQLDLPYVAAKVIEVYTIADIVSKVPVTWPVLSSHAEFDIENLEPKAWEMIPGIYMRALYRASTPFYPLQSPHSANNYCTRCRQYTTKNSQKAAKFLEEVLAPSKE